MAQPPKTNEQIQAMREGGKILAQILEDLKGQVHAGVTGCELDAWVAKEITARGASATYHTPEVGFPGVICISVNEQIVHGIPTDDELQKGDIVSFDLVITYKGMMTDAAFTMMVDEKPTGAIKNLLSTTEKSLYAGIDAITEPVHTGDIGAAIEKVLTGGKLSVIRELVGHGVGNSMHMPPELPNWGRKGNGIVLAPGDTIAVEPMAALGKERIVTEDDNWTISSADGSLTAHFEHTVLILEDGAEILTRL